MLSSPVFADETATYTGKEWLAKAGSAMKTLDYHGTVIFMKNDQIDTMKYRHTVEDGIETERLTSLNSPLRELVRKSNQISCLYKDTHKKIESYHPMDRSFIVSLPLTPERLDGQYLLAVAGQELIAMRPSQIIAVLPKDELRYARKIWVDRESSLPLKVEVYGSEGNALEQVMFTEFAVDPAEMENEGDHAVPIDEKRAHNQVDLTKNFDDAGFRLNHWPAGFEKVFFVRNNMQPSKKIVDHLLISDGFSNVSVYFETKGEHPATGLRTLGSVNSYSRVIGNHQVTVLGEVPAQTVEFVASGVALHDR
ncbi:MAG: MucB/RseB C-terminal domain-containing protein [Gammaproteobacteria bacterium]